LSKGKKVKSNLLESLKWHIFVNNKLKPK